MFDDKKWSWKTFNINITQNKSIKKLACFWQRMCASNAPSLRFRGAGQSRSKFLGLLNVKPFFAESVGRFLKVGNAFDELPLSQAGHFSPDEVTHFTFDFIWSYLIRTHLINGERSWNICWNHGICRRLTGQISGLARSWPRFPSEMIGASLSCGNTADLNGPLRVLVTLQQLLVADNLRPVSFCLPYKGQIVSNSSKAVGLAWLVAAQKCTMQSEQKEKLHCTYFLLHLSMLKATVKCNYSVNSTSIDRPNWDGRFRC